MDTIDEMNLSRIDLNLLVVFQTIYSCESVSVAAREMALTQSAVSNALSRLRDLFQDELFIRSGNKMLPTPKAQSLKPGISNALSIIQGVITEKAFHPSESDKVFRLVVHDSILSSLLPSLISHCKKEAPQISFQALQYPENALKEKFESGVIDMAIGLYLSLEPVFMQKLLYEERFVSILRKDHPLIKKNERLDLNTFLELEHIQVSTGLEGKGLIDQYLNKQNLKRKISLKVPNFSVLPYILLQTDMIASIPEKLAMRFQAQHPLVLLECPLKLPTHKITMNWHRRYQNDPANQWLRKTLTELNLD